METIDWVIVGAYFALTIAIGLWFRKKGASSLSEYFVSGRSLPWWLAGTSMVATTFAADTPLAVTGIVAREGVSGNWVWWCLAPSGLMTVFFFAALWRRSGVMTDVELVSVRYGGRPARFLRGFRAIYLGVLMNGFILGWVNIAMIKILGWSLDLNAWVALAICLSVTLLYSALSGLWGIVVVDVLQFVIGMGGTIALAFFAVDAVGGLGNLRSRLAEAHHPALPPDHPALGPGEAGLAHGDAPYGDNVEDLLSFFPGDAPWSLIPMTFAVFLAVNWWASWYPGAEPGGGGYIAQRMFACKSERHAMLAGLWYNCAHYALRPWPWIIAGLCGIALYGNTLIWNGKPDPELPYVQLILDHLPTGWRGLLMAAFAAAYMSTISTQLNWGASYLVNDVYRPFVRRNANARNEVMVARMTTVVVLALSVLITLMFDTVKDAWEFVIAVGSGTGLVLILRWLWWRINAWSEIVSMISAFVISTLIFTLASELGFGPKLLLTVGGTTVAWIAATFLTRPESPETLRGFCERVNPPGPGWGGFAAQETPLNLRPRLCAWGCGLAVVYGVLFGVGNLLIGTNSTGWALLVVALFGAMGLAAALRHPCFADPD
ncbi:MAG: sodium:solute symporter family protein [Planctomycetota bacterium]|nr:sodium:solute symporter family protein [Planctomycetota bacterium]